MNMRMAGIWAGTTWLACAAAFAADEDYVETATFTSTVSVAFSGTTATVSNGAGSGVTWSQNGANVAMTSTIAGVEYRVSGTATNASLQIGSSQPLKLTLNGVNLAGATNPAIGVWSGSRCYAVLAKGTTNVLADSGVNAAGGAFYAGGPLIFSGPGYLAVSGLKKHGIYGAEEVRFRDGEIAVPRAATDAIHASGSFRLDNGTLSLSAASDGIDADNVQIGGGALSILSVSNAACGIHCDGTMTVGGGLIDVAVRGAQSKGITATDLAVDGGTLLFRLTGSAVLEAKSTVTTNGTTVTTNFYVNPSYCTAVKCDSNLTVNAGTLVVTHTGLAGKGLSADGDVTINGGTIDLYTSGGSSAVFTNKDQELDMAAADCLKVDGTLQILGGTVRALSTGAAGDAIAVKGETIIGVAGITNRPNIRGETTGQKVLVSGSDYANPKAVTCEGRVTINGGTISLATANDGGEGLESKTNITINGGMLTVAAYDDCIQADSATSNALITINGGTINVAASGNGEGLECKGNILINGGHVEITAGDDCINATRGDTSGTVVINGGLLYCYSSNNDGIDANGDMTINGGFIIASGTESPEESFDSNTHLYVNGGTLVGTAGSSFMCPVGSQSNRYSILYNGSAPAGTIVQIRLNGSDALVYKIPRTYSGGGGGPPGGSSKYLYLFYSSTNVVSGASGTIVTGATVSAGTEFHGYYTGATVSGGTTAKTFTVTNILTTVK